MTRGAAATVENQRRVASDPDGSLVKLAVLIWVSFVFASAWHRALPDAPEKIQFLFQVVGIGGAALIIVRRRGLAMRTSADTQRRSQVLFVAFAVVPAFAAFLALAKGSVDDAINHAANLLLLLAAVRMDPSTRLRSARIAVGGLLLASILLGLVYGPAVEQASRSALFLFDGRLQGLFGSPNALGQYAALLVVLTLITPRQCTRHWWASIALGTVAIALAASQTSAIVAVAALVIRGILELVRRGHGRSVLAGSTMLLAVAGIAVAWMEAVTPGSFLDLPSKLTLSSRTNVWAVFTAQDIPTFGIGQGGIETVLSNHVIPGATGIGSVHNAWLDAYVRDGVLGLLILIASMVFVLGLIVARRCGMALVAFIPFLIQCVPEVTPTHVPYYALFFVAVATPLLGVRPRSRG